MKRLLTGILQLLSCSLFSEELIPREKLFEGGSCLAMKVSPDAKKIAYVGVERDGTMNLFVSPSLSMEQAKKATAFKEPEIRGFHWLPDSQHILLLKDKDGTAQFRLYLLEINTLNIQDLTAAYESISAKVFCVSARENRAIIGINNRNPKFHDLYLLDASSKTLTKLYENDQFINFVFDDALDLRMKVRINDDCSLSLINEQDELLFNISAEDAFHTECLKVCSKENALYLLDSRSSDTTQLKKVFLGETRREILLGHDPESDITDVYFEGNEPVAYTSTFTHQRWHPLNNTIQKDIDFLISKIGVNFKIAHQSRDSSVWVLRNSVPERGVEFWLYKRSDKQLELLVDPENIGGLSKMYPLMIPSSDGLELVSYLTLPKQFDRGGKPEKPLPLILIPHGGPFKLRDSYGFSSDHQWLANRGYAVLSVNFRSSSGFGKKFVNAGNGQWGKRAHQDLLDAAEWCIRQGIAATGKIAIYGGSYGGYAALAGLTFSPEAFACTVAICGPSNLKTVLDKVPFYWEFPLTPLSDKTVSFTKNAFVISCGGNPDHPEGIAYLHSCSPLNYIDRIQKPLLLIHGANDPIVAASESDQIFEKMEQNELPILYLSFPDEGHGIKKSSNAICYLAYSEWFLAQILGGKYEPLSEEELRASSVIIKSYGIDSQRVIEGTGSGKAL